MCQADHPGGMESAVQTVPRGHEAALFEKTDI